MSDEKEEAKPKGRPRFVPSPDQREKVRIWCAWRVSKREMARRLGIAYNTFESAFAEDLEYGAVMVEGDYEIAMHHQIMSGKKAAFDSWKQTVRDREWRPEPPKPKEPETKLGKKEAAVLAAQQPDLNTSMGELMARRVEQTKH